MVKKKQNSNNPAERKNTLSIKQRDFLNSYIDKNSPTYGNITRSYMKAYNTDNYNSAAASGFELLKRPRIITEYERLCNQYGLGSKVRMTAMAEIVSGNYQQKTTKHMYSKDKGTNRMVLTGKTEETKTPTARERLTGIQIIERLNIEHKKAGLQQIHELSKDAIHLLSSFRDVTPSEDDETLLQIAIDEVGEWGKS